MIINIGEFYTFWEKLVIKMPVLEKRGDIFTQISAQLLEIIERVLMDKRVFKIIIKVLNKLHLNYITRYFGMDMLEAMNV